MSNADFKRPTIWQSFKSPKGNPELGRFILARAARFCFHEPQNAVCCFKSTPSRMREKAGVFKQYSKDKIPYILQEFCPDMFFLVTDT